MDKKSLQAELSAIQVKLSALADGAKAAHRDLTDNEAATIETDSARAIDIKSQLNSIERGEKNARGLATLGADTAGEETEFIGGIGGTEVTRVSGVKTSGTLTPQSIKAMAANSVAPMAKALVAGGSSVTAVQLESNPLKLATPPANLGILGVVPVVKRATPSYSYVKQSLRTNNAAVVASGALKPTSVFTVESVTSTLKVVAHLSEYVDTYLLEDNSNLEGFLQSELTDGIFAKVTALAVATFSTASGIQTQTFSTNIADSLYLGASKAQDLGYNPDVVLLSRATYDALMLAKDTAGNYLYRNPQDSRLDGLYPVVATGLPANSAIVLDSSKVAISTDTQGIQTKWDAISKIDYNQIRALVEGRFEFDVLAPAAIVKVALV